MKRSIIWFKTDLRLTDNETLVKAIESSEEVIPFFCLDERLIKGEQFGFKRIGSHRLKFLLESVRDLDTSLREKGSGLIFRIGIPEQIIPELVAELQVSKVFAKKEVAHDEKEVQSAVEKELWKHKCLFEEFSTSTLYHAVDLPFGIRDIPDVFTKFRKRVELESSIRPSYYAPEQIKSPPIAPTKIPSLIDLGFQEPVQDLRSAVEFRGGEQEAIKRLNHYFFESKALSNYKETRNGLIGADYSSKFSAWLAQGCISARWIYHQVKAFEKQHCANDSTYWLIFELIWRDYFRFIMKKHEARIFELNGFNGNESISDHVDKQILDGWINGETGDDFVDANMHELKNTGFMSNRGRQNVASYLIDQLKLDWRLGAAYFEEQLIDYDVSSNWGNWAYLAGVGNDPRGKRVFNTEKQAKEYDPVGKYRNVWLDKL
jgi:deoxyribodipyrimidine photo-lyase